ncbi:LysR substrate-binding domain-containing protein [Cupriavidus oxalaticus]|jgi:DNA-binding transcriptional LysR family regulator|uniref:LysR family transcriptional regulator n=1 Tax=Cupriavidus oxalaticus TaxID=96344 RepID=A0A375G2S4_9BURK|nr:LysR substrate-binding domain-containing protein [Cupriavidus oxalaticus]QEZ46564.1 LysR family transcriptional regulator [Cupriavidus oxalaticus]QRQ85938.1 LysR family transcriptional regulator [Cupriavidus oxalaticus]QRQ95736.1 LysR family transcriptional regulator [Cupriavidus oxalaticus]WQD84403.1 LysR substrate-binding domain-containing protein [Cupriavidus oxalaticus]SPC05541.1 Transcriptional regulator, LysR family [Cupriavidus oxalaticus]
MRALELRQLRYFLILARELHFGRAAELAFVTQPALSQQLAKLEELVGVQLVMRDRRQVALTPAGVALRDGIDRALAEIDLALRRAREAGEHQAFELSLGMVEYTNLPFVPPALIRLQALYPEVKIVRHEMNGAQQMDALLREQIDVGFAVPVSDMPPGDVLGLDPLLVSGWALLMRKDHRLASLARLRVDDLAAERLVVPARAVNAPLYDALVARCKGHHFTPNFVYETMQAQMGIALVEQGLGVMLGATYVFSAVAQGLVYRLIDGLDPLVVHQFYRKSETNALILDFLDITAEEARRAQQRLDGAQAADEA